MQKKFLTNLVLIILLNLLIKPLAIFGIDAAVQNRVGAEDYGLYFSLLNFTFLFNILLDLGINNFTTKNVAQYPEIVPKYFGKVVALRLLLFFFYVLVTLSFGMFVGYEEKAFYFLFFLIINQLFVTIIAYARSHLAGLLFFKTDAIISVLDRVLLILFCGILLFGSITEIPFKIEWFIWIQTVCYAITCVVALIILVNKIGRPKIKFEKQFSLVILRQSLPFALLILLMMVYTRTDSVMIERLHENGSYESGVYAQGFRLLDAFFMFGMIFANLLFPIFSNMLKNKESIKSLLEMSSKMLVWGALAIAGICFFNAELILGLIYTNDVQAAIFPFQLLMITFVGMSITLVYGTLLTANGNLKFLNQISGFGLILNIIINLFLIPEYGAVGASIATLITQGIVGIAQFFYVTKIFEIHFSLIRVIGFFTFIAIIIGGSLLANHFHIQLLVQLLALGALIILFKVINVKELIQLLKKEQG